MKPINLIMALPSEVNDYRAQWYKIGISQGELELKKAIKSISLQLQKEKSYNTKNIAYIAQLESKIQSLQDQLLKLPITAAELASRYSLINLDDASNLVRLSFNLFQRGQLDSALSILSESNFDDQVSQYLADEKALKQRKKYLTDGLLLKADFNKLAGNIDSAEDAFQQLFRLDSNEYNTLFSYANFLVWSNRTEKASEYYVKALNAIGTTPTQPAKLANRAMLLNNLGNLYTFRHDYINAEILLKQGFEIIDSLFMLNQCPYNDDLLALENSLGNLDAKMGKRDAAKCLYENALLQSRTSCHKGGLDFRSNLAMTLTNLGVLYWELSENPEAMKCLNEAKSIYQYLATHVSSVFELDIAMTLADLAGLYKDSVNYDTALAQYYEALRIYTRHDSLAKGAYDFDLSGVNLEMGNLYLNMGKYDEAEAFLKSAVTIYKNISVNDHKRIDRELGDALNTLAYIYTLKRNYDKAKITFDECDRLLDSGELDRQNSDRNLIASFHLNRGNYFNSIHEYQKANQDYNNSLLLQEQLAEADLTIINTEELDIKYLIAKNYADMGDTPRCESMLEAAIPAFNTVSNNSTAKCKTIVAKINLLLGQLYATRFRYERAEILLSQAEDLFYKLTLLNSSIFGYELNLCKISLAFLYQDAIDFYQDIGSRKSYALKLVAICNSITDQKFIIEYRSVMLARAYGQISWCQILGRQFQEGEKTALRGLSFGVGPSWIKLNLAHALLLEGKIGAAKQIYQQLKPLKTENGKTFFEACQVDFRTMELNGIHNDNFRKILQLMQN